MRYLIYASEKNALKKHVNLLTREENKQHYNLIKEHSFCHIFTSFQYRKNIELSC